MRLRLLVAMLRAILMMNLKVSVISLPHHNLTAYFKHQLKIKIWMKERLFSPDFSERWVNVAQLCRVGGEFRMVYFNDCLEISILHL